MDMAPIHIYGGDGSPWTQAVLTYLHYRNVKQGKGAVLDTKDAKESGPNPRFSMVNFPTPRMFTSSGCVMPVLSQTTGYTRGTYNILAALGCKPSAEGEWEAEITELELLFLDYALTRVANPFSFFHHWVVSRDEHPHLAVRVLGALFRPLLWLYFFILIWVGRFVHLAKRG
jgi:hypothetical protein